MRNPFIAGSWVRGDNFFGRSAILRDILEGERHSLWVVGARRLGKTSLMKELEYRIQRSRDTPFVPLYWDLQGSGDARGLAESLVGSVEDSETFRRATDISVEDLESLPAGEMLATLVRRTVRSGRTISACHTSLTFRMALSRSAVRVGRPEAPSQQQNSNMLTSQPRLSCKSRQASATPSPA